MSERGRKLKEEMQEGGREGQEAKHGDEVKEEGNERRRWKGREGREREKDQFWQVCIIQTAVKSKQYNLALTTPG